MLFGAIIHIITKGGNNNVAQVAISTIIENKEDVTIQETDDGNGYYFKIDKDIIDHYMEEVNRAYYEGYYKELHPDNADSGVDDFVYDKDNPYIKEQEVYEWFGTKDYKPYLVKMIRAQIASTYPKLGDYEGEGIKDKVRQFKR